MIRSIVSTAALLGMIISVISSCSYMPQPSSPETARDQERRENSTGSFFTGRAEQGITIDDLTGGSSKGSALPINALLWRASIDTLSVMPLSSVDTFGGTIITEWYRHPDDETKQIKIAIFILDQELRSDAIRAEVYVRERPDGMFEWTDAGRDEKLARRLEDLILTRAREIRSTGISETN